MSLPAETARAQASSLLEPGAQWPQPVAEPVALAWALKDLCYEAWSREPARAARAAEVLAQLAATALPPAAAFEIGGLAAWTAGIAAVTRGQMAQALEDFDQAAAALNAAGRPDPAAQTQVPKIMALSMLGRHDEAAACAEAAQRNLLKLGNVAAAARVSLNIGGMHVRRDAYAESARHCREAAVLFARLRDHEHSVMADIGLLNALRMQGDFEEAARIHARARMRAGVRNLELQLAQLDEHEALLELARGRYPQALAGLESARHRYEKLALPQQLAIAEKQLADAYLELRLLPEALSLFEAAVEKYRALQMPDEQALALVQRGRTEALLQLTAADTSWAAAAELFAAQGNAVGTATVMLARAELALTHGDAPAALAGADEAAAGFATAGQADGQSRAELVRAHALLQVGQAPQARAVLAVVLARARALQQLQVQVRCLTGLGLAALALDERAQAVQDFEAAIELFEDQRSALPADEIRRAFLSDHLRPYQELLRLALQDADAGRVDAATVLDQLERRRARALDEQLAELADPGATANTGSAGGPAGSDADADADAEVELHALRERLNWLYLRLRRLQEEGGDSPALRSDMLRTERELLERARRRRLAAAPARASAAAAVSVAAELQRALSGDQALVAYGVVDDELFACVVTAAGVQLIRRLADWTAVLDAVRAVRFQIETLSHGEAAVRQHLPMLTARAQARLARLQALIWQPLQAALGQARSVLVVPHAQLGAVPFAALHDGVMALGARCQLALVPSARAALRGLQRQPVPARRVLALGESSWLPHAALEAQGVAALFGAGQAFVGAQASLVELQRHAGSADVIHLACHAQFRADNPRFSALHLDDGALTVERAEVLSLKPCTVVLSACETALSESGNGDEMVGLVRGFLVAGAARVLASLWPVDDAVTARFMAAFYGALVQGQGTAAAVQTAQEVVRREHPHPCFWGAFTLYGGW